MLFCLWQQGTLQVRQHQIQRGDAAIATEGAQLAQEIVENELVVGTDAYKNGHIVYLAHPAVWYTAEGGVTALDLMLADLESTLLQ